MEKFLNLPEDRQKAVIDGAMKCFAANGYKKASVSDIANAAGISKAMIFHYFGTKKSLYFYLIDLCNDIIINEIKDKLDPSISDFFERIRQSSRIKIAIMKRHPYIPEFLVSVFFEADEEVKDGIRMAMAKGEGFRNHIVFDGVDEYKFKEGVEIKKLMKMLIWIAEGFANQLKIAGEYDFIKLNEEFEECMEMLRRNLYKDEYI